MFRTVLNTIIYKITGGNERSVKATYNIAYLSLIKGVSILLNLLIIPITIKYVSPSQYGIWITLSSMIVWISFFDIGFSNGLRNRFTEALATNNVKRGKELISTAYVFIGAVFGIVMLLLLVFNNFINWSQLLNAPPELNNEIRLLGFVLSSYFCLQFILRIITTVVISDQKPAIASLIDVSGQVLGFLFITFLVVFFPNDGSLLKLGFAFTIFPLLVLVFANFYLFNNRYKAYSPSIKYFNRDSINDVFGLGIKFFVIQIAGIIQFQTANFLISRFFGPTDVTNYNIAFRYFSVLNMIFMIMLTPQWSAVTDAYVKHELLWIKKMVQKYLLVAVLFAFIGVGMLFSANTVYRIWIGENVVTIPFEISFYMSIYFIVSNFVNLYVQVLNGIGAIKLQFYICFISPVLFILGSYVMVHHYHMGVAAIVIASIVSNINGIIVAPLQYYMVMKGKRGIWIA